MMNANASAAVQFALRAERVLLCVPDARPVGVVTRDIDDAIKEAMVHGFEPINEKLTIKHRSGGLIRITSSKLVRDGQLDGQWFHQLLGEGFLDKDTLAAAQALLRWPEKTQ